MESITHEGILLNIHGIKIPYNGFDGMLNDHNLVSIDSSKLRRRTRIKYERKTQHEFMAY